MRLRLRNTGDVVDEYRFEPVGDIAPWTTVEPQTLRLYPGTTGTVELTFAPPRTPDATAGPNPYAVRITPTKHPEATTVPEGNLTITPFTEVRAELVPPTVKGRFRGRPKLAIDNLGNTKLTASVSGSDNGDQLSYDIHPGNVQIEPGRAAFVKATLKPRQIIWFGSKEERPYALAVQRSGVVPQSTSTAPTYSAASCRGWLATFLGIFLALAITFVMLWIAYKPQVTSAATELPEAGRTALPQRQPVRDRPRRRPSRPRRCPEAPEAPRQEDQPKDRDRGASADSGSGSGSGSGRGPGTSTKPDPKATTKKPAAAKGFLIIGQGSNRCVDVTDAQNGKGKDGTPLQIWDCAGTANQKWDFRDDGTVRSLGCAWTSRGVRRDDGAVIQVARCSGNPAQQFVLSTAPATW